MSSFGSPLAAALVVATLVFGCSSDDSDDGGGDAVTFTRDIHPILQAKCSGSSCHSEDQAPFRPGHGSADVQEAYEAATGDNSVTGQPVYERILERITSTDPGGNMPPAPMCTGGIGNPGCITEAELALIEAWIEQGTPL